MRTFSRGKHLLFVLALAFPGVHGSAVAGVNEDTVASVNGDRIRGLELRESLGLWGGAISASGVPLEKKREALGRLIDGRLLEQAARSLRLDKTEDFSRRVKEREQRVMVSALFRMNASSLKIRQEEIRAESERLRKSDKGLDKEKAWETAKGTIWQREVGKLERDLVAAAREEASVKIDGEAIARIGRGERVEDNVVLGTVAATVVTYGEVKVLLRQMSGGRHGGQDLWENPKPVSGILDSMLTERALLAYARNRKVEETEWMRSGRREQERSILIDLLTEKEILNGVKVSEKEIGDAYAKHSQMLVRDGKTIPLAEVEDEIRRIVQSGKRNKAMKEYVEKRKRKADIKTNDRLLQKI